MRSRRIATTALLALVLSATLLIAPTASWAGALTCLTGTDPSVAGDLSQVQAVRASINSACSCANFDGSPGKAHSNYVKCVKGVISTSLAASMLRKQCTGTVTKYYSVSTCGFPASQNKEPCVKKSAKGKVKCAVKPAAKCTGTACANATTCIDAADSNGDGLIGAGDSGACVACCGGASTVSFTTSTGSGGGTCGEVQSANGSLFQSLSCGQFYDGAAALPIPSTSQAFKIASCIDQTATLASTTSADTGSNRTCSGAGCAFGPPVPVVIYIIPGLSTCNVLSHAAAASGTLDCSTGESISSLPLSLTIHFVGPPGPLTGDVAPELPGPQPCPVCLNNTCRGGTRDGLPCTPELFSSPTYVGLGDSKCCSGGSQNNEPCTDGCLGGGACVDCSPFPTSQDCPPSPNPLDATTSFPATFTTGTQTLTAHPTGTQQHAFCSFCRNSSTGDYQGPPPQPCVSNADCTAPFDTCAQFLDGFYTDPTAQTITVTGAPPGDLRDLASHATQIVSAFCIPPTNSLIDKAVGAVVVPGMLTPEGTVQLK